MQRKIVCALISFFLMVCYTLSGVARTAKEDFPVKFPEIKTDEDYKALMELKGDRKLTAEEKKKRDLLVQLLLDKDATKTPLPEWQDKDLYRQDFVRFRRRYAAELLGLRIAHKSVIPVLVQVARDKEDYLEVQVECVLALSRIWDKSMIPHLIDLLGTDLSDYAFHQLRRLFGEELQKQEKESPSEEFRTFFGYRPGQSDAQRQIVIDKWKAWWKQNQDRVVLSHSRTTAVH